MRTYLKKVIALAMIVSFSFVQFAFAESDTKVEKPHPSPFNLALEKLNVAPSACLFVGDNPDRDIKGAMDLGMKTCLAKYHTKTSEEEDVADYNIERFEDLEELVVKIEAD